MRLLHVPLLAALLGGCAAGGTEDAASPTRPVPAPSPRLATGSARAAPPVPETSMIRYHVSLRDHAAHRVHVRMTLRADAPGPVELVMPVWTPGSYLVREYARHVLDLAAADGAGVPLPARKSSKNAWIVDAPGPGEVVVEYELHANERSVRTNHVDADHAFLSPAATFLYVRGRQRLPARITVDAPAGWQVATGLPRDGDGWRADDLDALVDGPLEIGTHRAATFDVRGVPHRLVLSGGDGIDLDRLADETRRLCEEAAAVFDVMPFDDYTFLVVLTDEGGGGLEHGNSSVNHFNRWKLATPKGWRELLSLLAHEYFHAWNVKRFRPAALGPFDYEAENYTTDLWVAEGLTSYYDDLVPLRARLAEDTKEFLSSVAKGFGELERRPGARRTSLARASWDTWIKQYRPDENSFNHTVSYYDKGALVGLLLDLRIRRLSGGAAALADALRLGWRRYTARGEGYPDGALRTLASEAAGADLGPFFDAFVDGTEPLRPDEDLSWVGLTLAVEPETTTRALPQDEQGFKHAPVLDIEVADRSGLCRVTRVIEDGPAWRAGLNVDDLLLAVDGMRVAKDTLADRLDRTLVDGAARPVTLTFFRGQSLRSLELTPRLQRLERRAIRPVEAPDEAQRAAHEEWLGWPLPGGPDAADAGAAETAEEDGHAPPGDDE